MTDQERVEPTSPINSPEGHVPVKSGVSFAVLFISCCLCIATSVAISTYILTEKVGSNAGAKIVYLDTDLLLNAKSNSLLSRNMADGNKIGEEISAYTNAMRTEIARYKEDGFVIIGKEATLSVPQELDITNDFAAKLGIDLTNAKFHSDAPIFIPKPTASAKPSIEQVGVGTDDAVKDFDNAENQ